MLKLNTDLVYANIISQLAGSQAVALMTGALELPRQILLSTSIRNNVMTSDFIMGEDNSSQELSKCTVEWEEELYGIVNGVHESQQYHKKTFEPIDKVAFLKAVRKEQELLRDLFGSGNVVYYFALEILFLMSLSDSTSH